MAKRRRKDARPGEILDAAISVFAEKGFSGARVEEIAKSAGVAKGTVYLYFETKDDLFVAAVNQLIRPVFEPAEKMLDTFNGSMRQFLVQLIERVYTELVSDHRRRTVLRILIAEGHRFPKLVQFYYEQVLAKVRHLLKRILVAGVHRGEFTEAALELEPMVVMAPAMLAVVWKIVFEEVQPLDLKSYCESHLKLALDGIEMQ